MNFHTEKCFRYQTLLLLLIIHANLTEFQDQDPLLFADNFDILEESTDISFFEFSNRIMAKVYQLFFKVELHKVLEEMRNKLQLSTELIGCGDSRSEFFLAFSPPFGPATAAASLIHDLGF